ncbi:HupE/UreJ family protein [Psychromarinibacter sp. S121]|uniref:HupE/UreJ family protein n=1 Tax=Psychromarinibacter sp. S121 TaxID=3415127 RepID=UPI003C7D6568
MRRLFLALVLVCLAQAATAHFSQNGQARIIVLDRESDTLFLRIPAPLVFAEELSRRDGASGRVEAEFIEPVMVGGRWGHRLDLPAIAARPDAFMAKVANGYRLSGEGGVLSPEPVGWAIHRLNELQPFVTPDDARASVSGQGADAPWVSEAVIEIALRLPQTPARLSVQSVLPEIVLPPTVFIDNHLLDWQGGGVQRYDVLGQLTDPVTMKRDLPAALGRMIGEGVRHIIEGLDHVLFVVCLTLAATGLRSLLLAITGFTLGHSVTLIAGFFGLTPGGAWFPPVVEAAIAASIVWAGLLAVLGRGRGPGLAVTSALGLLHGFGFAFVLNDVLGRQAPDLVVSLVTFNIGVEIGQLMIVGVVLALLWPLRRDRPRWARAATLVVAGGAVLIAGALLIERIDLLAEMV